MKATGVIRKIDELGRVVIPVEFRRQMELNCQDEVEIYADANGDIILKKHSSACVFCGKGDHIKEYKNKNVCAHCINSISN